MISIFARKITSRFIFCRQIYFKTVFGQNIKYKDDVEKRGRWSSFAARYTRGSKWKFNNIFVYSAYDLLYEKYSNNEEARHDSRAMSAVKLKDMWYLLHLKDH